MALKLQTPSYEVSCAWLKLLVIVRDIICHAPVCGPP